MDIQMKKIAIYGKGGIGKSTISCNISAILAYSGKKILQIGCDPKHDSTFLLTNSSENNILEKLRNGETINKNAILTIGKYNVHCIELGGPKPGVGCAGRGIIKGLQILNECSVFDNNYDLVIYDVLGDVVCGGFFEPLQNDRSDEMYIVTSGELNSLFAANNLCWGFINNAEQYANVRLKGIIGNCRGIKNEEQILKAFSDRIGIPLVSLIPQDSRFSVCSDKNLTIIEAYPESNIFDIFFKLSENIIISSEITYDIKPFEFDQLKELYSYYFNI
jgi:nitrogenase iron protein